MSLNPKAERFEVQLQKCVFILSDLTKICRRLCYTYTLAGFTVQYSVMRTQKQIKFDRRIQ